MIVRDDVIAPEPASGQVLVEVKACGICGSDLHFVKHGRTAIELRQAMAGYPEAAQPGPTLERDVFMGHEFAGEVLALGPDTEGPAPGTLVTSIPVILNATGFQDLAYNNDLPAGYSEQMLLSAPLALAVPNGLDAVRAALTEPMAVGLHAVNRSGITAGSAAGPGDAALVLGCGPVGIAVIAALRLRGLEPVIASDFSPARRHLALTMGAHAVVDPAADDPWATCESLRGAQPMVVFEAVGVPGIIDDVFRAAPPNTRVVVVGVCMGADRLTPFWGIAKELNVQFVLAYDLDEFAASLRAIAEGDVDVSPMITSTVPLPQVPEAFEQLGHPDEQCKIVVAMP